MLIHSSLSEQAEKSGPFIIAVDNRTSMHISYVIITSNCSGPQQGEVYANLHEGGVYYRIWAELISRLQIFGHYVVNSLIVIYLSYRCRCRKDLRGRQ